MPALSRFVVPGLLLALVAAISVGCGLVAQQSHIATGLLRVDPGPNANDSDYAEAGDAAVAYVQLARSRPLVTAVIERLGLDEEPDGLLERVSSIASEEDLTIRLEVRDDDPSMAREIVLALGDAMIERVDPGLVEFEPEGEDVDIHTTIQEAWASRAGELFGEVIEREGPPAIVRYRLEWLEKPKRVDGD